jgi:hypothetical protein
MDDRVHSGTLKIARYTKNPSHPLFGPGGEGVLFVTDPPQGLPDEGSGFLS